MTSEKEYITKEKLNELTAELDFLKTERRKEIAEKLEFAKSLGDMKENAEYQEARENQVAIEERILKLESIISSAEIISMKKSDDLVRVGSTVTIKKTKENITKQYQIVGSEEADMLHGKISNKSPLGEALIGNNKGASVQYETPQGKITCLIVDIK